MPLTVHHLAVLVRDLDRAEAFYADVLGLPVIARHDDEAGRPRAVWLGLDGGAFLAIEKAGAAAPGAGAPGWHCVALTIPLGEREPWRTRLMAAGHPVERETRYTLYARDPDGALVALSHHPTSCAAEGER
jgi:catechol 2,3-dioxygenase-like lactoylglutathione lyase family enzyme